MSSSHESLKKYLKNTHEHPHLMIPQLFREKGKPVKLYSWQKDIVDAILTREKRVLFWAATRAGKSFAVALAILTLAVFQPGVKIRIIAPTEDHSKIIMNYIAQHITDHPTILRQLPFQRMTVERLKTELSKKKITLKNGSDIMLLSATISSGGRRLYGEGGDIIIVDECEQIPSDIVNTGVMRMLGDNPEKSSIILIGNPVQKGYMFDAMKQERWRKMVIDWRLCVREGRFTRDFVDERRDSLTETEFMIWYEARYPEDYEDTLIPWNNIERAVNAFVLDTDQKIVLADLAEMGTDYTVITVVKYDKGEFEVTRIKQIPEGPARKRPDPMEITSLILQIARSEQAKHIIVDDTGGGFGVLPRLREVLRETHEAFKLQGVRFSHRPNNKTYLNKKAEIYFTLKGFFDDKRISIPNHSKLKAELNSIKFEVTSNGKLKILDPQKSPDYADSLVLLGAYKDRPRIIIR